MWYPKKNNCRRNLLWYTLRALLSARECWAKAQGCADFASDCELSNRESLKFHLNMGFEEANRIICFTKKLYILPRAV